MKTFTLHRVFLSTPVAAIAAIVVSVLTANGAEKPGLSAKDKAFIKDAGEGGLAEVQMGEAGGKKSTNEDVKALAAMLVKDHTAANEELAKIAASKGVEVPKSPSFKQQASLKVLEMKSGASYDAAFAKDAVEDHKKDIAAFEKAAKELDDPDLKAFAEKNIPTLKEHLSMAEKAAASTAAPK